MFVVRTIEDDEEPDFKGFSQSADAKAYFTHIWESVFEGEMRSVVLFEVAHTQDVRAAVEAVKSGDASAVTLLHKTGPLDLDDRPTRPDWSKSSDWRRSMPVGPAR